MLSSAEDLRFFILSAGHGSYFSQNPYTLRHSPALPTVERVELCALCKVHNLWIILLTYQTAAYSNFSSLVQFIFIGELEIFSLSLIIHVQVEYVASSLFLF